MSLSQKSIYFATVEQHITKETTMNVRDLDLWWTSLTTKQKERIATKAARKTGKANAEVQYPECTVWWIALDAKVREKIRKQCTDERGHLLEEWK